MRIGGGRRVVVAPDSFKGTAAARDAARAIAEGWARVRPEDDVRPVPTADGGEGTLDAFETAHPGAVRHPVTVLGPDGRRVRTSWLGLPDGTAVVELAATSGITLLEVPLPDTAHTIGFGEAIAAALDAGAPRLVLAIGGSCSTDGGAGMLAALGARILDDDGRPVPAGSAGLGRASAIDLRDLRPLPAGGALVLTDVVAPLHGPAGASAVYGPQKGVMPDRIDLFDDRLRRFAALLPDVDAAARGAGAAGGTGFGLLAWGARLIPGSAATAEALGLDALLVDADLLITGEGRFDEQSTTGKVVGHLLGAARAAGTRVALVAGAAEASTAAFDDAVLLGDLAGTPEAAMADPLRWLREAGAVLAARRTAAG
ncbi:glycerate kinase [uncultured Amnibacterium sp.]|uniref:glycerate kinase n=1 Tax=uncultured Amnibacterium sp. TaxID=1631851 RepID=UPI0035CA6A57